MMTTSVTTERIFNFSAGPGILPEPVLKKAQDELFALPGVGMSVLELSHRGKVFEDILARAKADLSELLGIPANYKILFLQGGASLQFSMLPMNLMPAGGSADYILTGSWGKKAVKEAKRCGTVNVAATTQETGYDRVPTSFNLSPDAAYVHYTSNETIEGVEFFSVPETRAPLVCDMSSDILSRPIDVSRYGLIYAGAQKNMGPAGATVVVLREDLLDKCNADLPTMLDYKIMAENDSLYNTPPCFTIYMIGLVARYLLDEGGLSAMEERNRRKAKAVYEAIDGSDGFYRGHAQRDSRSLMNVTWRLPSEDLEAQFVKEAKAMGMEGLKGHRSVGGIRASIYNAFPLSGCDALAQFMADFRKRN